MPPSYVYGAPYLNTGAASSGLVPLQATQLSHAAAIAAATNQFYEYQNAVATAAAAQYPNQYTAAAGYDAYTYSPGTAAAVAGKKVERKNLRQTRRLTHVFPVFYFSSQCSSWGLHPIHVRCPSADGSEHNRCLSWTGPVPGSGRCCIARGAIAIKS